MGILNVTPDSFSDGGRFAEAGDAVDHGLRLVAEGADILDIGGESTRPGASKVSPEDELRRVIPVIEALAGRIDVPMSVDTTKAVVARAGLEAGAVAVNDVSAGRADPEILGVVAEAGAGYVAMHMQGDPETMQVAPAYADVVSEVADFLVGRVEVALDAGIARDRLVVDPGIGFGKTLDHNLALLAGLEDIVDVVGVPVVVGASRKAFIGTILGTPVEDRDEGTLATTVWAFAKGASMVRVHDVRSSARAARLLDVMNRCTEGVAA